MSESILVNFTPQETRVAILQQGTVQELHIERAASVGRVVGNIYLGQVLRILPGMQSAFIDIGLERSAFLHVADMWCERNNLPIPPSALDNEESNNSFSSNGANVAPGHPIEKLLSVGQSLLVQVVKDPIGSKGARLSTQISLAGRMLVYLPQDPPHIGISQRIEDETERERLRSHVQHLLAAARSENNALDENGGFIIRTVAEGASEEALCADLAYLSKRWRDLQQTIKTASTPSVLYTDLSLMQRVLRDLVHQGTVQILVDSRENYDALKLFASEYTPAEKSLLEHYDGERPLFDLYGVEDELQRALSRRVDLKSGGYLIFDQTEAMTTVDVNTGGFVGLKNFAETVFKTNLEAAQAIARQLRLRNLGGIIILDFIDMDNEEHQSAVLDEFNKAVSLDRMRITVDGFSSLGLVEVTRKRTRESLTQVLCEGCPVCEGRGHVKTSHTVAYEILREVLREARQFNAREYRVLAAPNVVDLFNEDESPALLMLCDFIGKPVSLQAEASYLPEQYDIVLL